ncbi:MAG: hypothetical protein CMM01_15800 [Rhodopirellula sp.]|nr:hypothetical protein [Rhodopirellula sp.]
MSGRGLALSVLYGNAIAKQLAGTPGKTPKVAEREKVGHIWNGFSEFHLTKFRCTEFVGNRCSLVIG